MAVCPECQEEGVVDPDTGSHVCPYCGRVLSSCEYQHQAFSIDGQASSSFHWIGGDFGYRERKLYRARTAINDLTFRLGLSGSHADEASALISDVTEGALGGGEWFPVLIAACSYLVARRHCLPLSISEAAAAISHDACDLGRMVTRVARHLDLPPLPEFNAANALERAVLHCPSFEGIDEDKAKELMGQGQFLLNCATKWFLTTGRQPLPMIAAILAFVAEVNGVKASLEAIAKEINATFTTSNLRLKELREALIRVARSLLPWGNDVTATNLVHNTPLLIRLMERKSKSDLSEGLGFEFNGPFDSLGEDPYESKYLKNSENNDIASCSNMGEAKLSEESISMAYQKVLERFSHLKANGEFDMVNGNRVKKRRLEINTFHDSLEGRWDAEKKLTLREVLERDVGFDFLPPSYVAGIQSRRFRRAKIKAAKQRIEKIMMRPSANVDRFDEMVVDCVHKQTVGRKRRKKKQSNLLDWEDCVIEILLLHRVKEDEIEEGHYNRLLDLHVFNL